MKVALIQPPISGHGTRGIGIYTQNLKKALEKYTDVTISEASVHQLPHDVDLYHFPYFDPFFLTLPWRRQKPTVLTIHDLIPLRFAQYFPSGLRGNMKWMAQKYKAREVQAIITDSQASKSDIIEILNIKADKVHAVYLAPDEIYFKKQSEKEKEKVIQRYQLPTRFALYVGDGNWNKNISRLVSSAVKLRISLVLVSSALLRKNFDHPWEKDLRKAHEIAHRNPGIHVIGSLSQQELAAVYQCAQMVVIPSYYEGFGLPVVEAFASNCPVVASHGGSLKEVVGDAGFIIDPWNTISLEHGMQSVFENVAIRKKLIVKGQKQIKQFTWKNTALQTAQIYATIV